MVLKLFFMLNLVKINTKIDTNAKKKLINMLFNINLVRYISSNMNFNIKSVFRRKFQYFINQGNGYYLMIFTLRTFIIRSYGSDIRLRT